MARRVPPLNTKDLIPFKPRRPKEPEKPVCRHGVPIDCGDCAQCHGIDDDDSGEDAPA